MLIDNLAQFEERHYEIYLCKSYYPYEKIGCLSECAINRNVKWQLSGVSELEFDIPMYWNDINQTINENFDLINPSRIVQLDVYLDDTLQSQELFTIRQTSLISGEKDIKSVQCFSLQDRFNKIKVRNFKGTTKLYDPVNPWNNNDSTISGICNYLFSVLMKSTWSVSYISNSLKNTFRTFDISESSILDTINQIQELWGCIFFYDTFNQTISIKDYNELSGSSGIVLSTENYIKQFKQQILTENIVTRMYVEPTTKNPSGIRSVNITGENYIDNFSFYRSSTFMSAGLLSKLTTLDALRVSKQGQFTGHLDDLADLQYDLGVLELAKIDLESQLRILEVKEDGSIKYGLVDSQNYSYWHNLVVLKQNAIISKQGEIEDKEDEIAVLDGVNGVGGSIRILKDSLSYETNLTTAENKELLSFVNEHTQKIDCDEPIELLAMATQLLNLKCTSNFDIEVDLIDVFSCQSESFTWDKIRLGYLVDLQIEDFNLNLQPRITMLSHNIDSNSLSAMISNKLYYNDDLNNVSSHWIKSTNTSTIVDNERDTYKEFDEVKNNVIYDTTPISTAKQTITLEDGSALLRRGIYMRDSESANGQMKILGDRIVFTKDNWSNISVGITSNGITTNGSFKLLSENLYGGNNLLTIDGNGIKIYGSDTAGQGIQMFNKNNVQTFSLDSNGNISMVGNITMQGGSISWTDVNSDPTISTAQTAANNAQSSANTANSLLADIASDSKITPVEKISLQKEWDIILAEKVINVAQALEFSVSSVDYVAKYDLLYAYVVTDNGLLTSLTTTTTIVGSTFRTKFKDYYDSRTNLLNNIADKNKTYAENAQGTANTAVSNAATAQSSANTANNLLSDIASDSKLTPVEKISLKKEWDAILSEKPLNDTQADLFTVSKVDYGTKYTTLYAYVVTDNGLLTSLATTTDIVGATFRAKFKDYYDSRTNLLNAIADKARTLANTAQGTANSIANGTYSGGTFFNNDIVQSGTVLTNSSGMTNDDGSNRHQYVGGVVNPSWTPLGADIRIWAGDSYNNRATAPFRVSQAGAVTCSNLTITGGTISIGSGDSIFKADTNGIYLGNSTFASAPFRVSPSGAVNASNIAITGGSISVATDAYIGNYLRLAKNSFNSGVSFGDPALPATAKILYDPGSDAMILHATNLGFEVTGSITGFNVKFS